MWLPAIWFSLLSTPMKKSNIQKCKKMKIFVDWIKDLNGGVRSITDFSEIYNLKMSSNCKTKLQDSSYWTWNTLPVNYKNTCCSRWQIWILCWRILRFWKYFFANKSNCSAHKSMNSSSLPFDNTKNRERLFKTLKRILICI